MADRGTPVVFVHGLWLHATSWQGWVDQFREAGYDPVAPGWPGEPDTVEGARLLPDTVADSGIDAVVAHFGEIIASLPSKPVVVGHSFGGLTAQRLLGEDLASAAVALDPAPIKGVLFLPPAALRSASVVLKNPANRKRSVMLTAAQFRFGFGNAVSKEESAELYARWAIPSPGRPLFEGAVANFHPKSPAAVNTHNSRRGPLLITAGRRDQTVPATISRTTQHLYRRSTAVTELIELDRGHSLTIDSGSREVATTCLEWLRAQGAGPVAGAV